MTRLTVGDCIYEWYAGKAYMTELITKPVMEVQHDSHVWKWKARIVQSGHIQNYCINESAPQYGPKLFRHDPFKVGYAMAEPLNPPFDTAERPHIVRCSIFDDVDILGHTFHGLADVRRHVEMSLNARSSRPSVSSFTPESTCMVHVGEVWMPYPTFDAEDAANENRSYSNFIFRSHPLRQEDMMQLYERRPTVNDCRLTEDTPVSMLPLLYFVGDGETMLLAREPKSERTVGPGNDGCSLGIEANG